MYQKLLEKEASLSLIGLGYVGLPIALAFARKIRVIGFDINENRVDLMKKHIDPSDELGSGDFENTDIEFTADKEDLKKAAFHIVAVPTPIDKHNLPDLTPLIAATRTVGSILKKGDYVVYESTVYPGATEEDCLPILEELSGLKCGTDFKLGYSPERINPGDKDHTITTITKVVSGCDQEALNEIASVYELVVKAGVHRASSIKVAEAAKIIENTQRDVNIALMNELSMIFNKMNINTYEVLEAAGTKWNFLRFAPGLVGGHCIGVDPYYLTFKASELGHASKVITSGRSVNDGMGKHIAEEVVKMIIKAGKNVLNAKALVMGATFKENVSDIRNSKVADVVNELKSYGILVDVIDPYASSEEVLKEYGYALSGQPGKDYDAVILAVAHNEYLGLKEDYFKSLLSGKGILMDIKGIYRNIIRDLTYASL
ncbi:MAG: nucleotide sugar dehydrogenase [Bacteroidales bacterium]|nr:nucleotide sugar dehydrogenase [Bacteroidales bacterium]MBN2762389.1 nucleotide sugar dehydrogenase [Bacteroidales bacterium]